VKDLLELLVKRVQERRVARKWSQEEFAHVSGLHRTYIGHIERGEKNISFANLVKISGVLGVTMSELLAGIKDNTGEHSAPPSASRKRGSTGPALEIKKILRQLRIQQAALDQSLASLEALTAPPTPASAVKRARFIKRRGDRIPLAAPTRPRPAPSFPEPKAGNSRN
jgi:transcriptional regulator with XRE-family HTH domain